ncbi:MAG: EAL domain-containing protein, partial [Ilumatobacter sp.]
PDAAVDHRLVDLLATSDPDRIVVEITEHERIDSYFSFAVGLEPLRRLGVRIAVDDVGAGFASFAHVLELKADIVKMDRSIVTGIDADPARQALAAAILELAVHLDASVVAEGVESEAELEAVYAIGIDTAQGYLLHRPAPLSDLSELLDGAALAPTIDPRPGTLRQAGRYELAMYHSPLAVAVIDLDGRIGEVNPALCSLTGYSEGDLSELSIVDLTHPEDLGRSLIQAQRLVRGELDHYLIRQRFLAATGESLVTEATVVLVRTRSGRPLHFVLQFGVPAAA